MRHHKIRRLAANSYFTIFEFKCSGPACGAPGEEAAPTDQITIPVSGMYVKKDFFGQAIIDPTCFPLFNRDQPYEVVHPSGQSDVGLVLSIANRVADDFAADSPAAGGPRGGLFRSTASRLGYSDLLAARTAFGKITAAARWDAEDGLESLYALLDLVTREHGPAGARSAKSPGQKQRHRKIAQDVIAFLNENFHGRVSLSDLAEAVTCSPYHLCRTFRAQTGHTVNQHLTRLRLGAALELLKDPERSITSIALDLGFASHSHFTAKFSEKFGTAPSGARKIRNRLEPRAMAIVAA